MAWRYPGPQCSYRLLDPIDTGTNALTACRPPGYLGDLSLFPELYTPGFLRAGLGVVYDPTDEDKSEFKLIGKMHVVDYRGRHYANVRQYMEDVSRFFGSAIQYRAFAVDSDTELENTSWEYIRKGKKHKETLRSQIEFGDNHKKQDIFYRWVRKAYINKYGEDVDVPALIRRGMSKELEEKIKEVRGSVRVKKIHDENFHAGGFNPRPVKQEEKHQKFYMLGTLSEHAIGMAVDIDDTMNAQLSKKEWEFIEKKAGKKVNRFGRWDSEEHATALWTDINDLNDAFMKNVASEVAHIEKERAAKAEKEKAATPAAAAHPDAKADAKATVIPPLQEVLGEHYPMKEWYVKGGFFHLPLELVLELRAHGFEWGATFPSNADLHHFEIPEAKPKDGNQPQPKAAAGAAAHP